MDRKIRQKKRGIRVCDERRYGGYVKSYSYVYFQFDLVKLCGVVRSDAVYSVAFDVHGMQGL